MVQAQQAAAAGVENDPDALKRALKDLMAQRDAVEGEVAGITGRLEAPGQPGLHGSLVDKEVSARWRSGVLWALRARRRLVRTWVGGGGSLWVHGRPLGCGWATAVSGWVCRRGGWAVARGEGCGSEMHWVCWNGHGL